MPDLRQEPWVSDPQLQRMIQAFAEAGEEIRFVGGCVRDALLEHEVHDVDMATTALPQRSQEILESLGVSVIPTGIAHGTVTAIFNGWHVEVTTLRQDMACDGRHAEVQFGSSWEGDAARRDFTINALYCDGAGKLYDYHHGMDDIKAGEVRFIGDAEARIREDYLRMLRFFRFWSRFSHKPPHAEAMAACRALAEGVEQLSGERIQKEMTLLLDTPRAREALVWMREAGLEPLIWGEVLAHEVLEWLMNIEREQGWIGEWPLYAAALLSHTQTVLPWIAARWRLSRADATQIQQLLSSPLVPNMPFVTTKATIRRMGRERFCHTVLLQWAREAAEYKSMACMNGPVYRSMLALAQSWVPPLFPIRGEDLVQRGVKPGKALGQMLARLEQLWENSDYKLSREELLEQAPIVG